MKVLENWGRRRRMNLGFGRGSIFVPSAQNGDRPSAMNGCDHAGLSQRDLWATGPCGRKSVVKWAMPKVVRYGALRYILAHENFRPIDNFFIIILVFFSSVLFNAIL
jgi:hypothetical protein